MDMCNGPDKTNNIVRYYLLFIFFHKKLLGFKPFEKILLSYIVSEQQYHLKVIEILRFEGFKRIKKKTHKLINLSHKTPSKIAVRKL